MDQSFLAGRGNVYADEILLASGLHPRTKVQNLGRQVSVRLYEAMQSTISEGVRRGADPEHMPDFLLAQRGKDGTCPRCGGPLEKITVSTRSTYFCPHCQGEG
jgi:formamidopyrimidine-DNA glycosylase